MTKRDSWLYKKLRWTMFGSCALMTFVSLIVLVFFVKFYFEVKDNFEVINNTLGLPSFNKVLSVYYFMIGISFVLLVTNLVGCMGAYQRDRCLLFGFIVIMSAMLVVMIVGVSLFVVFQKQAVNELNMVLKGYLQKFYGSKEFVNNAFDAAINYAQENAKCCGFDVVKVPNYSDSGVYGIVLFWIESSQWGAHQVIDKNVTMAEDKEVEMVPRSCCKVRTDGCNRAKYVDRLQWSMAKEASWKSRIHGIGCKDLAFNKIFSSQKTAIIAILCAIVVVTLASIIVSCSVLYQSCDDTFHGVLTLKVKKSKSTSSTESRVDENKGKKASQSRLSFLPAFMRY